MVYRTVVAWLLLSLGLGVILAATGCNKPVPKNNTGVVEERVSIAPGCLASGQHCFAMRVGFNSATATGRQDHVARLSFSAGAEAGTDQPMELVDASHPQGATVELDACSIKILPEIGEPAVVSQNGKECRARTYYDFTLFASEDRPVADFTIDETGNLTIVTGSVNKPFDVQLVSTHGRSIYMIFQVAEITAKAVPLFAFEWNLGEVTDKYTVKAADGWSYEFLGNDGTLGFFHASCLGTLPDDLTLVAMSEQGDRTAELKEWAKTCGATSGG